MLTVLRLLVLRWLAARTFGGLLATLALLAVPLAALLKLVGIPLLIVLAIVALPVVALLAVVGLPVLLIVLFSFLDSTAIQRGVITPGDFTLANYVTVFGTPSVLRPFIVSIVYSALASVIVVGGLLFVSRIIQRYRNPLADSIIRVQQVPGMLRKLRATRPASTNGSSGLGVSLLGTSINENGVDTDGANSRRSRTSFDQSPDEGGSREGERPRNEAEELCRRMWDSAEIVGGD